MALQSLSQLFSFLLFFLIAKEFSASIYGSFSLGMQIGQAISLICTLGSSFILAKKFGEASKSSLEIRELFSFSNFFLVQGFIVILFVSAIVFIIFRDVNIMIGYFFSSSSYSILILASFFVAINRPIASNFRRLLGHY